MAAPDSTLSGFNTPSRGSATATAPASGPVFQSLPSAWQGGGFPVDRRRVTQPAWLPEKSPTFATMGANNEATQAEIDALRTGLQRTLPAIDRELAARVFADSLPLAGNQLAVSSAQGAAGLYFATALQAALDKGLATLTGAAAYTEAQVEAALSTALTSEGIGFGLVNLVATDPAHPKLILYTRKSFSAFTTPLDGSLGLPGGLGLRSSGMCQTVMDYTFNFVVGIDSGGFYLDTANNASQFSAGFRMTVPRLETAATLSQLRFRLADESATDGDAVPPTLFSGSFAVDLLDPSGADNKLRLGEIDGALLAATLSGQATINLNLASDLGTAVLPDIAVDLNVLWSFNNAVVDPAAGSAGFGNLPTVAFRNISLGLGSFFSDFVEPVFGAVQVFVDPLQPIVDVLQTEIEFLSILAGKPVTLLDVAGGIGAFSPETVARLNLYGDLINFIKSVPSSAGNVRIDLGDYSLGSQDPRAALFQLANAVPQPLRAAIAPGSQDAALSSFLAGKNALPGGGLSFPIIENPLTAINLLFGRPVDFFTYHVPGLDIDGVGFDDFYRIFGPFGVRLTATVEAHAYLDIGYDSTGISQFAASGDPEDIFNGFYVVDQPGPEGVLNANLEAFGAFNVILAEAGVGGGIKGDINAFLNDNDFASGDGRIHLGELRNSCLFELSGEVTAGLSAYITIGFGPFSETFEKNFGTEVLASFNVAGCDAAGTPGEPRLAHNTGPNVALHVGMDASLRQIGTLADSAEHFSVVHKSGAAGSEIIAVMGTGLLNEAGNPVAPQPYTVGANGRITANGGALDDNLALAPEVLSPATLRGAEGHDRLVGGGGDDSLQGDAGLDLLVGGGGADTMEGGANEDFLDGQDGDDILRGGSEADILLGGPGGDVLDGGPGYDTASYAGATVGVVVNRTLGTGSNDAQGDSYFSIERIVGSPHADILNGGPGSDNFGGGAGNDVLDGKDGDDLLAGEAGADVLTGGVGNDFAAYTLSLAGVNVSLLTGQGVGGDAQGDTLSGIESLQGSHFGDVLEGSHGPNWLRGLDGANPVEGGPAPGDILRGLGGNDLLEGGKNGDTLEGGDDHDTLRASTDVASLDPLVSGGLDTLRGGPGNDMLYGDAGSDLLEGGDGGDQLYGGKDADILRGGAGQDFLEGGAGNDDLDAGEGSLQQLLGGEGNDRLFSPGSLDTLDGGEGNDTLISTGGVQNILRGGDGNDTLSALTGNDTLDGGTGDDRLDAGDGNNTLTGGDGNDTLYAFTGNDMLDGGTGDDRLDAGDGNNLLTGGDGTDTLLSGAGVDRLEGGPGNDYANSGAGHDIVLGGDGNDSLDGGSGNDRVDGGAGNDSLSVGALRGPVQDPERLDHLFGGAGFDTITADFSNQTVSIAVTAGMTQSLLFADGTEAQDFENVHDLFTGSSDDLLRLDGVADNGFGNLLKTGAGHDIILAGGGSDDVDAGDGNDFVNGGANNVVLTAPGVLGTITGFTGPGESLTGGAGTDMLSFEGFSQPFASGPERRYGVSINLLSNVTAGAATGITIRGFENVIGTEYGDEIIGDDGSNTINPLHGGGYTYSTTSGPDRIDGKGGLDTLVRDFSLEDLPASSGVTSNPGAGTNPGFYRRLTPGSTVWFEDSISSVSVEQAHITGAGKNDQITGLQFGFNDILTGLGGNDVLGGYGGSDLLLGGEGNDVLAGQGSIRSTYDGFAGGRDVFDGGPGDDLIENIALDVSNRPAALAPDARFQLDGGLGFDILSADFSNQTVPITWDGAAPKDREFADGAYYRGFEQLRYFVSGPANDSITQPGRIDNIFHTNAGDDVITPGLGNDIVNGGAGDDLLVLDYSRCGLPTYTGITGGGSRNNFRRDNPGGTPLVVDYLAYQNFERLHLTGTPHADEIRDFTGDDRIYGGAGSDVIISEMGGNNFFDGGEGNDTLTGNGNSATNVDDTFIGGEGNDTLTGWAGNDTLLGGPGNDLLIGASDFSFAPGGRDLIDGGAGDDFVDESYSVGEAFQYMPVGTVLKLDGGSGFDMLSADFGREMQGIVFIAGQVNENEFASGTYIRNFEQINDFTTGTGNDVLTQPGRINNQFSTREGNDIINPGLGLDIVWAGPGDDQLILDYSLGDDAGLGGLTFNNGTGERRGTTTNAVVDRINGSGFERFHITGGGKTDRLVGGNNVDTLIGGGGDDILEGGGGNDVLTGGDGTGPTGANEVDRLRGGAGQDLFVIGDAGRVFYDDGAAGSPGTGGYLYVEDFMPSQSDRLRLFGSGSHYQLGPSPIAGATGTALYHDSNGNGSLDPASDELIAILSSTETLTRTNTLLTSDFTRTLNLAMIGFNNIQIGIRNDGSGNRFVWEFSIFETLPPDLLLEIQGSTDLGINDPWRTIASKAGSGIWNGLAAVTVSAPSGGRVTVTVPALQPVTSTPASMFRLRLSPR